MTLWVNENGEAVAVSERSAVLNIYGAKHVLHSRGFKMVGFCGGTMDQIGGDIFKIDSNASLSEFKKRFKTTMEYRIRRLEQRLKDMEVSA